MKLGCGAQIYEIPMVKALGFDYVELRGWAIAALLPLEFEQLLVQLTTTQLLCRHINAYCPPEITIAGPSYDRGRHCAYAQRLAERAKLLGVCGIGIGSPGSRILPDGFDRQLAWQQTLAFVADTADIFEKVGIQTGLEALGPCFCNFINRMEELVPLLAALRTYSVGVVLDFYNMEQNGEGNLDLHPYAGMLTHAHISDDMGSPFQRGFLHTDKYALHEARLKSLLATGYDGALSLEVDVPMNKMAAESLRFLRSVCS